MKLRNILSLTIAVAMTCLLGACGSDDNAPARTDASKLVAGTYKGTMVQNEDGSVIANDVVVTLIHSEAENTQAVNVVVTSATVTFSVNAILNAAKAGDSYYLTSSSTDSGRGSSMYVSAKVTGSEIVVNPKLQLKDGSYQLSGAGSAKAYTITATKVE